MVGAGVTGFAEDLDDDLAEDLVGMAAARVEDSFNLYLEQNAGRYCGESRGVVYTDLIADALHAALREGLDAEDILDKAGMIFHEEAREAARGQG